MSFLELIALLGGWSVVTTAIASWFGTLAAKRITIEWENKAQKDLIKLENQLTNANKTLSTAIDNYSKGMGIVIEKKIVAIQETWNAICKIRNLAGSGIMIYDILLPEEYGQAFTKGTLGENLKNHNEYQLVQTISDFNIEQLRPLIGENLWMLYFIYRAFFLRINYFVTEDYKSKSGIRNWRDDKALKNMLEVVLTKEEIDNSYNFKFRALESIIVLLEQKILSNINFILSGEQTAQDSFTQAKKLFELYELTHK